MTLSLSPADQLALTIHTKELLTFLLDDSGVLRGRVTAWLIKAIELVQSPEDRAEQQTHLAAVLVAATRHPRRHSAKVQRLDAGKRRRSGAR